MSTSILVTQCLQNDFVKPIGTFEPLPNLLHIGSAESRRLVGDGADGPVARLMRWAYGEPDDRLRVVHVRDWHDPDDPEQASHLAQFGAHCVRDSEGARFVFDVEPPGHKDVPIVSTTTLNDFIGTGLADVLDPYRGSPVRIGVTGVWTEAKVSFLAYEIRTRYPDFDIAVCSALTASSSRGRHFRALEQLEQLLGARVFTSMGEFVRYLGGDESEIPLTGFHDGRPEIELIGGNVGASERTLLRYLFRDCRTARFHVLDGGYSGNRVLGSESVDGDGHPQAPHVVKIGPSEAIGRERTSFERVESVLGNAAPRITEFADHDGKGALRYRYASMGGGATTFQKLYMGGLPDARVASILSTVFHDQLGRLYRAAERERGDLLDYYGFDSRWTRSVAAKVRGLVGDAADDDVIAIAGRDTPNVLRFYETLDELPRNPGDSAFYAFVHGDLNGANIIIDEQQNVWLIDFFHTHRGHVLKDLIKLENDLLYIFTPLDDDATLARALALTDQLIDVEDLARGLPPMSFGDDALDRAWRTVALLRSFYPSLVQSDRDPLQLLIAQLRYAVHTLGFYESSERQKKWALYTAGRASEQLRRRQRHRNRLRVDWLDSELTSPGRLGLTLLPGRGDYGRGLDDDLRTLAEDGVQSVVCLVPNEELERFGVPELLTSYERAGFDVLHVPIVDQGVSSVEEMDRTLAWIRKRTTDGKSVLVHCVGGLGRSGLVAACYVKTNGRTSSDAVRAVRAARSPRAIESTQQEQFIAAYR